MLGLGRFGVYSYRAMWGRDCLGPASCRRYRGGLQLHGDGVVGVAGDVPARILIGVGEQRAGAGDVFFRLRGIDFEIILTGLIGNSEHAGAMHGGRGASGFREELASVEQKKIGGVDEEKESDKRDKDAAKKQVGTTSGNFGVGHWRVGSAGELYRK
jgi:hypothetical protein